MIDKVPFPVKLDSAQATMVKIHVHRYQSRFQQPENGIVRCVVEVSSGNDPVDAHGRERIRQEPQPLYGDATPGLRLGHAAVLGRVVIHQDGEGVVLSAHAHSVISGLTGKLLEESDRFPVKVGQDGGTYTPEYTEQDVPRSHHRVSGKEMTRL